jgi:hypothetical protein
MASSPGRESEAEKRRKRLAAALRENLKRRKALARGRAKEMRPDQSPQTASNDNQQNI